MTQSTQLKSFSTKLSLQDKLFFYLLSYKKWTFLLLLGGAFVCAFIAKSSHGKVQKDEFIATSDAYRLWINNKEGNPEVFASLKKLLKKHPELKPLYHNGMIQHCLSVGQIGLAKPLITGNYLAEDNYYSRFSDISLKIEQGQLQQALEDTLLLKGDLISEEPIIAKQHSALFFHNLLRAAFISSKLGKKEGELHAWKELKKFSERDQSSESELSMFDREAFEALCNQFSDRDLSIQDYIKHREKILSLCD